MKNQFYKYFFNNKSWKELASQICKKLRSESVLLTALPDGGITFFINFIQEIYSTITKDNKSIIIFFDIIPKQTEIFHISSKIIELINYKLNFPRYLEDLSCQETIRAIIKHKKELIIIINRFERLKNKPETLAYLNSLRGIHL